MQPTAGPLRAPFPWFGGKAHAADQVWKRFGNPENYIEPFFGSGAVLLGRPSRPKLEVINDRDGLVANFWRAVKDDPVEVARHASDPVNEIELHARHRWIARALTGLERRLMDTDWCDPRLAGWWAWGVSLWIGHGFGRYPNQRKRPAVNGARGITALGADDILQLASRLSRAAVLCGDWRRAVGGGVGTGGGMTAVFLDPPYGDERDCRLYRKDTRGLAGLVAQWALANGAQKGLRIALCGLDGEHPGMDAAQWRKVRIFTNGGNGSSGNGRTNCDREVIWFSPSCIEPQPELF